jgi:hypothetical protein
LNSLGEEDIETPSSANFPKQNILEFVANENSKITEKEELRE